MAPGGGQLHQAFLVKEAVIGEPGKSYLVHITPGQYGVKINGATSETIGTNTPITVAVRGGTTITGTGRDFIAVWQEIDGYTNH